MLRLSSLIENIKSHYTVVVVGSGYGGGIAASRLARAGQQVCVLERGKELQPGEYPNRKRKALREMQVDLPGQHIGSQTGLYDLRVNKEINVFVGCGLGGTSLVNASVSLQADPRVFDDPCWPPPLHGNPSALEEGYVRAYLMLRPTPYPKHFPPLPKLQSLEESAKELNEKKFYRPDINVTFEDGINQVGVEQHKCESCGDCVSGCNYGAKNTVLMNYLPDAKNHGAEIYTQVAVRRLERKNDHWLVHYQLRGVGREKFNAPTMFVSADIVILAAGTLGSTEILLRSQGAGLLLSKQVGLRFTGNGDVLGFGYNNDRVINGIGFGRHRPGKRAKVGPCITGIIDRRDQEELGQGMVVEEGAIPGAVSAFLPFAFAKAAWLVGKDTDKEDSLREKFRELHSLLRGAYHGAVRNTQTYLVMTHDDGSGRMYLEDDRLRIDWPGVGRQPIFKQVNDYLKQATEPLGGTYIKNPLWSKHTNHSLLTVHPLGGCVMAEDAESGVVNHKGQVFSGARGKDVYESLYVCDGSIIPRSLGVNPLLTIAALAERSCTLLADEQGWQINYNLAPKPQTQTAPQRVGIQFTETMKGYFSTKITDDYQQAAQQGRDDGSTCECTLTIIAEDLEHFLTDPQHPAKTVGSVVIAALPDQRFTVTDGDFELFVVDPEKVETRQMRYCMKMISEDGQAYYFEGFKEIHDDKGFDLWSDTTTLFITVYEGENAKGQILGKGIVKISLGDFLRQLSTFQVKNAKTFGQRLKALARYGRFFGAVLLNTYGGIFAKTTGADRTGPPREKRPLRAGMPQTYDVLTSDRVKLYLTRYRGGDKGPVLLSPGFGTSRLAFSIDTIATNFPEYLYERGYDVWLLDYRASPCLQPPPPAFSVDDIAARDYPAAVNKVIAVTGFAKIQMVVHCVGSMAFFMSMLGGHLEGKVRSAVCSQLAGFPEAPILNEVKAALRIASLFRVFGVKALMVDFNPRSWRHWLLDRLLMLLYPTSERCKNPICRRILFIFGESYKHARLNNRTHEVMHEVFGRADLRALKHLSLMLRRDRIVNEKGEDVYLRYHEQLRIPIAFIHGEDNKIFPPRGTEMTYNWLCKSNGADLYTYHRIPEYAHMDCFIGRNAVRDVFPYILQELEKHN